jgi:hypothetical protein
MCGKDMLKQTSIGHVTGSVPRLFGNLIMKRRNKDELEIDRR